MPSVAEILEHELLEHATVIAGHAGLDREVRWVHNSGVPDAADWLNGGELVMTTFINMPEDEEGQRAYIQKMAEKDVAGLAITIGRYIKEVPEYLLETADSCQFPLIEIPSTSIP